MVKEIIFNSTYGEAKLTESEVSISIPAAGKYKFVQLSDCHFSVWEDSDDDETLRIEKYEADFWRYIGCMSARKNGIDVGLSVVDANNIVRERVNKIKPDAVFFTGDTSDLKFSACLKYARKFADSFEADTYVFPGNHDYIDDTIENIEIIESAKSLFDGYSDIREINFDGFDVVSFYTFNDASDKQIEFLENKIKEGKPFIIFQHVPVCTDKLLEVTGENFLDYYSVGASKHSENAKKFCKLVQSNKDIIPAVFAGHAHFNLDHDAEFTDFKQYISNTAFSGFYRIININ